MATSGSLIAAADYESIRTSLANILYLGSGTRGYGTTPVAGAVSAGQTITAAHWVNLKTDILTIAAHQGALANANITAVPSITAGTVINATDQNPFITAASYLDTNRFNVGSGQYSEESLGIDQSRNTNWSATVRHFFTLDFGSADAARYFFNAGGKIKLFAGRSGGTGSTQDNNWTSLLTDMGNVFFNWNGCTSDGTSPGSGNGIGFYNLTNVSQQVFTKVGSGSYSLNDYTVAMYTDVANNGSGGARYVYVQVFFNDDHTSVWGDTVTGTLTNSVRSLRPSGSYVNVVGPTATNSTLLSS